MYCLRSLVRSIREEMQDWCADAQQYIDNAPPGRLVLRKNRGCLHFAVRLYVDGTTRIRYVKDDDKEYLRALALKEYFSRIRKLAEFNLKLLAGIEGLLVYDLEAAALSGIDEASRTVMLEINAEKRAVIDKWVNEEYVENPYKPEQRIYPTLRGEMVRSKGERDIVDSMFRRGIPYKLEYPLELEGETIYSDVIALRESDMRQFRWEHSGMLEKERYVGNNYDRIAKYASAGILVGEDLIITGETRTKILSTQTIEMILDAYFPDSKR